MLRLFNFLIDDIVQAFGSIGSSIRNFSLIHWLWIDSKKVDFLFDDCNKALIDVKEFVAKEKNREKTAVSLPASTACFSIVLPTSTFDMDDDLMFTFHETFFANQNETKHESFAHDMDMGAENVRDTTEEASVRVTEAEPLDDSRDHENASRQRGDPESYDINVEPQMSEDIRKAQEEHTVRETICTIVWGLVDPHGISGDNFSSVFILSICDCLL